MVAKQEPQSSRQRERGADAAKKDCVFEADSKVDRFMPCRITRMHARLLNGTFLMACMHAARSCVLDINSIAPKIRQHTYPEWGDRVTEVVKGAKNVHLQNP